MCTFQFVNIGNIDLNIVEYGLMDRKRRVLIPLTTSYFKVQMITEKQEKELPLKIQTQDSINFIYSFDQIIKYIESTQYSNKNDSKKLYFYFKDVTGKVFCKVVNRKKYKVLYQKINYVLKMNKSSNQTIIKIGNSTQMRYKGTITFLNNEKGFAFVKIKKGEDLFVIADNIVGYKTNKYEVGDEVDIILNSPN